MAIGDRGFASMDRAKQREIASKGGRAAHRKGTGHEWTSEEARDAGRKGGLAKRRISAAVTQPVGTSEPVDRPAEPGSSPAPAEGGLTDLGAARDTIKPPFE